MRMADERKGLVAAGASLVWRRRGILWWVFAVNIALGALGTMPAARQLHQALRHSLAAGPLYKGFDLGMFYELARVPEVSLLRFTSAAFVFAGLFAVFMLFVSGGILEVYRRDRRLDTGDFFAASGAFFWRFLRLALISLVVFALLGNAYLAVEKASDYLGDKAAADQVGFVIWLVGVIILILLTMFVRLWFDIAKVRALAKNERGMLRNTLKSFDITQRQVGSMLWMYLHISLVAWITLLIAFLIWTKLPPTAILATFILLELAMLVQLGARLWQMASATIWYQRHSEVVSASGVGFTVPRSEEVAEPEPQLTPYPETELPPADA
jgi:hypothetical protein